MCIKRADDKLFEINLLFIKVYERIFLEDNNSQHSVSKYNNDEPLGWFLFGTILSQVNIVLGSAANDDIIHEN